MNKLYIIYGSWNHFVKHYRSFGRFGESTYYNCILGFRLIKKLKQ